MLHKIIYHPTTTALFKIAAITNFVLFFFEILVLPNLNQHHIINFFFQTILYIASAIIIGIISIRGIILFIKEHQELSGIHKTIKESIIIIVTISCMGLLFLDDELEQKIILYFDTIQKQISPLFFWIFIGAIGFYLLKGTFETLSLSQKQTKDDIIKEHIKDHTRHFLEKMVAVLALLIVSLHVFGLRKLSYQLLLYTKTTIYVIAVATVTILIIFWIAKGTYYLQKLYRRKK